MDNAHTFFCIPDNLFKLFGVKLTWLWCALYTGNLEILSLT